MDKRPLFAVLFACLALALMAPPVAGGTTADDGAVVLSAGEGAISARARHANRTANSGRLSMPSLCGRTLYAL